MREGWRVEALGQIAETRLGKTLPRGSGADLDGMPYLRNVNVQWNEIIWAGLNRMPFVESERTELSLRRGDILVCEGGEVGRLAMVCDDVDGIYFQNALHRVRVNVNGVLPEYLALALEHFVRSGGLEGLVTRVTIAHLNQTNLRSLPIPVAPIREQRRIVDLIGALDEATERALAALRTVEWARQALVDGLSGNSTPLADLLSHIDAGKSPEGVDRAPALGERAVLKVSAIGPSGFNPLEVKVVSANQYLSPRWAVRDGDVLMVRANGAIDRVGVTCRVQGDHPQLYLCDKTLRLVARDGCIDSWLLNAALASRDARRQLMSLATGSHMRNISQKAILRVTIPVPGPEQSASLAEVFKAIETERDAVEASLRCLRHARAVILTALLSGEHEIPESYDELLEVVS